jgi:hypothetical protein
MKANWDCPCCGNGNDSEYPAKCKAPNGTSDQLGIHSNTLLKKAMYSVYKRRDSDYADNNFRYMLHPTPPLFNRQNIGKAGHLKHFHYLFASTY